MPKSRFFRAQAVQRPYGSILRACSGLLLLAASACATTPASAPREKTAAEVLAVAPAWVTRDCRAYWPDTAKRRQVVCGIGSARASRDRVAARETAITRARASVARSLQVTIESVVHLAEREGGEDELRTIVHQLSSTSLRGIQLETEWESETGEIHVLVSLGLDRVQHSVRNTQSLSPSQREGLAKRAADAFAEMDAAFENDSNTEPDGDASADEP